MKMNKRTNLYIVIALALGFFLLTSAFIVLNQGAGDYYRFSSPDESANYFFSRTFAESKKLSVFDPAGLISDGWTSPRSLRSDFGSLKPVSFLGIILVFGYLASILGVAVIPFLTPFFAALGIVFFYLLVKKVFNDKIALISAFLLSFFPVYIYYSIRSLFHNVLFVVFLVMGLYFTYNIKLKEKKGNKKEIKENENEIKEEELKGSDVKKEKMLAKWKSFKAKFFKLKIEKNRLLSLVFSFFAGVFSSLALMTRTSEALWVLPLILLMAIFYCRRLRLSDIILFLSGFLLSFLPIAYYNQILYGSFFYGGYNELNRSMDEVSSIGTTLFSSFSLEYWQQNFLKIKELVFYFGFKPLQSFKLAFSYIVKMFPLLSSVSILGFISLFFVNLKKPKKKINLYLLSGVLISLFLIIYYGSWEFYDNPDTTQTTIGNSYTRYWLPIYMWLMPLASWFLFNLTKALFSFKFIGKKLRSYLAFGLQSLFVLVYAISSLFFVFFASQEGLSYARYNNIRARKSAEIVLENTEPDSVIITRYYDKLLFPNRRVIVATLPDDDLMPIIDNLSDYYPIYYYYFQLKDEDINYLNERRLSPYNLSISAKKMTGIDTYLYSLKRFQLTEEDLNEKDANNN